MISEKLPDNSFYPVPYHRITNPAADHQSQSRAISGIFCKNDNDMIQTFAFPGIFHPTKLKPLQQTILFGKTVHFPALKRVFISAEWSVPADFSLSGGVF